MNIKSRRNATFSQKEIDNFKKLCMVHNFRLKQIILNDDNQCVGFNIYVESILGNDEKKFGNIARYTNSKKITTPVQIGKRNRMMIQVAFRKSW